MFTLEWSEALKRKIRQDVPTNLGKSTWAYVLEAIKAFQMDEASELIDYELDTFQRLIDSLTLGREMLLIRLADLDEEEIERFHRERYTPVVKDWLATTPGVEESLQRFAEGFRTFTRNLRIQEDTDKYAMTLDPCGTGGRLRRTKGIVRGTKKAYHWSWSKTAVCYYCCHCCMFQEILPIEMRGYPICVTLYAKRPEDPCVHLYYKKPELIPDEYFLRIAKTPWRLQQNV